MDHRDVQLVNVCAQTIPPQWMRARALAFYLLVFQGSLAVGSGVWGEVARHWGVRTALLIAAVAMISGLGAGWRMKLSWKHGREESQRRWRRSRQNEFMTNEEEFLKIFQREADPSCTDASKPASGN